MGNDPVDKMVNTEKVNSRVFTFLHNYIPCRYLQSLKVNTIFALAVGFYVILITQHIILMPPVQIDRYVIYM